MQALEVTPTSCTNSLATAEQGRPSFSIRVVNVWNDLPANIVDFRSLQLFKKTVSTVDFSKYLSDTIFVTCLAISVLFICLYSCMSYYYLFRLSSFYFPDHCKCYLFSLVNPVYSLHV